MLLASQEARTFFPSSATWERRLILQSNPLCDLLLDVIRENRAKQRSQVHEFVLMPNHVHLILTPAPLAEVRHGTAEFCNFWCHQRDKSCLYNRGFRKSGVVQTYPLETSDG